MVKGYATDLLGELVKTETCITERELAAQLEWPFRRVQRACESLRRRKYAQRMKPGCYRATPAGCAAHKAGFKITSGPIGKFNGKRLPDPNALRSRMWRAMRMMGKFTINDLMLRAGNATEQAAPRKLEQSAHKYLSRLAAAGYLIVLPNREPGTAETSNGFKRYLLAPDNNTGPLAPQVTRTGAIYDPNRREVTAPGGAV